MGFILKLHFIFILFALLGTLGCKLVPTPENSSFSPAPSLDKSHALHIAIVATNDIHGMILPVYTQDKASRGGLSIFASFLKEIRSRYPNEVVWLDAGDQWQGTYISNQYRGAPVVRVMNQLGLKAATYGNHEFDFGAAARADRVREANYTYLTGNIEGLPEANLVKSSYLFEQNGVMIGVVGLTTTESQSIIHPDLIKGVRFTDPVPKLKKQAQELRQRGAQIIILVAHEGLRCDLPATQRPTQNLLKGLLDIQTACRRDDPIPLLLSKLPLRTVDAVVSGHTHTLVHHFVEGVPVVQGQNFLKSFNILHFYVDKNSKKLISSATQIEGPISNCTATLAETKACPNSTSEIPDSPNWDWMRYNGNRIRRDLIVEAQIQTEADAVRATSEKVLGQIPRPIAHSNGRSFSPLGFSICEAMRKTHSTDIGVLNYETIRRSWDQGPLTFGLLYETLPFDNLIYRVELTGREVKNLLTQSIFNPKGIFSVCGASVEASFPGTRSPKVQRVTLNDGRSLSDTKLYSISTVDYLVLGGDFMGPFYERIPSQRKKPDSKVFFRDELSPAIFDELNGPPPADNIQFVAERKKNTKQGRRKWKH